MRIAIVGCGYVADYYLTTLRNHPGIEVAGVFDRDPDRAERFARFHHLRRYSSLEEALGDTRAELVVNLTNPASHYEVSRAALEQGKHVYSEKPLAMELEQAEALVGLAEQRGRVLAGAPCTVLGEAAQTAWREIRRGSIGRVRLVYAELDDGPVHLEHFRDWRSISGAPWPWADEFRVGCTLEHAGYCLTWFAAFFGPARRVTSFSSSLVPEKGDGMGAATPDFSVGCIEFESGPVVRLTCSLYGPRDRAVRFIGDGGVLEVEDSWNFGSPVRLGRRTRWGVRAENRPKLARWVGLGPRQVPLVRPPRFHWKVPGANRIDFARGVAEAAEAAETGRACRLSARFALHVNEMALVLQHPERFGSPRALTTRFDPVQPMPWAA
jgi:predicted dehydrogenase